MEKYRFASSCNLPTSFGVFEMRVYEDVGNSAKSPAIAMVARIKHGKYLVPSDLATPLPGRAVESFSPTSTHAWNPDGDNVDAFLLRVHDQCHTSEIFGSVKCDCKLQLDQSMQTLHRTAVRAWKTRREMTKSLPFATETNCVELPADGAGAMPEPSSLSDDFIVGLIAYLPQEGRGIGLSAKVAAYSLQESAGPIAGFLVQQESEGSDTVTESPRSESGLESDGSPAGGLDTVDANRALGLPDDSREYHGVRDILRDLRLVGGRKLVLMTNNPRKVTELVKVGLAVHGRTPCFADNVSPLAGAYIRTKAARMGHIIE